MLGMLGGLFFLLGLSFGFYVPAMTNILVAQGLDSRQIQWAWLATPVGSLLSPLLMGALADNRFAAEKVFGWSGVASALLLGLSFASLDLGFPPSCFLVLLFLSWLAAAPQWSMMASLSMTHLRAGEREFPLVRLGATVGWLVAGLLTSHVLHADDSPLAAYFGAGVRLMCALFAFWLPHTPPPGSSRSWKALLGWDALQLLRQRDHLVFFLTTGLLAVALSAFYMWTPLHLAAAGDEGPTATMALGQISEIIAMLLMVSLMARMRVKWLLGFALGLSALRYGLFAWSGWSGTRTGLVIGVAIHGLCYTFYFITAQMFLDRRVSPKLRGQAQGLLALVHGGVGTLIGTVAVRVLYDHSVVDGHGGWGAYWAWLGGWVAAVTVGFLIFYRGRPARDARG